MKVPGDIIRAPMITEKGTDVHEKAGQAVFMVDPCATKIEIRRAVEELFDVEVKAVRTMNYLGKPRRARGRQMGKRSNWKKAYVTLAEGQTAELMEKI